MRGPWSCRAFVLAVMAAILFALAGTAWATEVTRESYREAADPICKVDTRANERIHASVRHEVRSGRLARPTSQLAKAARALKKVQVLPFEFTYCQLEPASFT